MSADYEPFRYGAAYGSSRPCATCGVRIANEHSLRESGQCDRLRALGLTMSDESGRVLLNEMRGGKWRPRYEGR